MTKPKLAVAQSGYGGRGYRIPGRTDAFGKQRIYPSVTTVLKQVAKPGLTQWVADQVAAFAVANIPQLSIRSDESAWGFLRFIWSREPDLSKQRALRTHHDGVRDDSAELGTNFHEIGDAWLANEPAPAPSAEEVEEMLDAFEEWLAEHRVERHYGEFTVVNDVLGYAGTGDGDWTIECLHDGPGCFADGSRGPHRCLVDMKTSRYTWPEHGMQLASMWHCDTAMVEVPEGTPGALRFEKMENGRKQRSWWTERFQPTYDRAVLLHVRPRDLDTKGERINPFCVLVDRTDDLDLYFQGFKGALALCESAYHLKRRAEKRALANV